MRRGEGVRGENVIFFSVMLTGGEGWRGECECDLVGRFLVGRSGPPKNPALGLTAGSWQLAVPPQGGLSPFLTTARTLYLLRKLFTLPGQQKEIQRSNSFFCNLEMFFGNTLFQFC